MGVGVEEEGDHHGDGIEKAGDEDGVVGVGLEVAVGGGSYGEVLVIELGVNAVAGLAEVETIPGLRGGGGCGEAEEEQRQLQGESHEISLWDEIGG
jgi:hypothetical protein